MRRMRISFSKGLPSEAAAAMGHGRPIVLLLDDDPTIRLMIKVLLEVAAGARVLEAGTNEHALKLANHFKVDLLLCNLARPCAMDGLEFLKLFRAVHPEVSVIVVSGALDPVSRSWAFKFGASACVTKLLTTSKLLEAVQKVLSSASAKPRGVKARPNRRDFAWRHKVARCREGRWGANRKHGPA